MCRGWLLPAIFLSVLWQGQWTLLCVLCVDTGVPHTLLLLVELWQSAPVVLLGQVVLLQAAASSLLPEELLFQEVRQERVRQQCIIIVAVMWRRRKDTESGNDKSKIALRSWSYCKELNSLHNLSLQPRTYPQNSVLNHTNFRDLFTVWFHHAAKTMPVPGHACSM